MLMLGLRSLDSFARLMRIVLCVKLLAEMSNLRSQQLLYEQPVSDNSCWKHTQYTAYSLHTCVTTALSALCYWSIKHITEAC
eukprot:932-Heterococcus_DN1.PRE.6